MDKLISVVVSTYNWAEALGMVLDSFDYQTDRNFEVIVADDGSHEDTRKLVEEKSVNASYPIKHFWQQDQGFRAARSRNGAVSLAAGDYFIITDGDCCVLPDFIESHRRLMEPGWFVTGKRCFLKKGFSANVLARRIAHYRWSKGAWFVKSLMGASNRAAQFLPIPVSDTRRRRMPTEWDNAQTCNLAVWREDFMAVDGFDAAYEGHGKEDSDFIVRIIRSGVKRKTAEYTSPVLHFYHGRRGKDYAVLGENPKRLGELLEDKERTKPIIGYSDCLKS